MKKDRESKKKKTQGSLALIIITLLISTSGLGDTLLEITDNTLWVGGYRIDLATQSKPIKLKPWEDSIIVIAESQQGTVELILDGNVTISDSARQYVSDYRFEPEPTARPTLPPAAARECRHCGAAPEDHTCPRCHKPYCQHDDLACSYRLNPVPTPPIYYNSDGKRITSGLTNDGKYIIGYVASAQDKKNQAWQPGKDYEKAHATPSPSPDPFAPMTP